VPYFDALWRDSAKRQFNSVMAWSVDRLGLNLKDFEAFLPSCTRSMLAYFLPAPRHQDAGRHGNVSVNAAFAEFERAIVQDRVRAGTPGAKANG
jgi:DNA invertase Pin-like site-specific DNA recombinase